MSRSKKKKIRDQEGEEIWRYPNKMTPYLADKNTGTRKFKPTQRISRWGKPIKITATEKLVTKNANRSLKKAMRQQSQQIIREALNK